MEAGCIGQSVAAPECKLGVWNTVRDVCTIKVSTGCEGFGEGNVIADGSDVVTAEFQFLIYSLQKSLELEVYLLGYLNATWE